MSASTGGRTTHWSPTSQIEIRNGIDGPIYGPTNAADWNYPPGSNLVSGGPMLDIIGGAWASHSIMDFNTAPYKDHLLPNRGQMLTILATGINERTLVGEQFAAQLDTWLTYAKTRLPRSAFMVGTENPLVAPASVFEKASRASSIAAWAARSGLTSVDTWTAFLDNPRGRHRGNDLINVDDIHPKNHRPRQEEDHRAALPARHHQRPLTAPHDRN